MKFCPQCNAEYPNDYRFCLIDGETLGERDAEQETLVKNRLVFSIPSPAGLSLNCRTCGVANSSDSRFCKNCGAPLQEAAAGGTPPGVPSPGGHGDSTGTTADPVRRTLPVILAGLLLGSLIIAAAIIYSSQPGPGDQSGGNNLNKLPKNTATATPTPTPTPTKTATPANTNTPAAEILGKTGRLSTNQNIRSDSNRYAESLGVHYQDAQVEVLEETSYNTEDGPSTWYRVRVIRNGCDREGKMGCGNDLEGRRGQAAMQGWMNARHITLD